MLLKKYDPRAMIGAGLLMYHAYFLRKVFL